MSVRLGTVVDLYVFPDEIVSKLRYFPRESNESVSVVQLQSGHVTNSIDHIALPVMCTLQLECLIFAHVERCSHTLNRLVDSRFKIFSL